MVTILFEFVIDIMSMYKESELSAYLDCRIRIKQTKRLNLCIFTEICLQTTDVGLSTDLPDCIWKEVDTTDCHWSALGTT